MERGIIYIAKNVETNKVYVGSTTKDLEERIEDHVSKAKNNIGSKFQEAILTYGVESFTWEQIDTALDIDELAKKEIKYIQEFNSLEDGYNSDKGGGFKKTIYKYNLDGSLNSTFENLNDAGKSIEMRKQDISRACWSVNHQLEGYLWSYDFIEPFIPGVDNRRKEVCQYNLDGNFLEKHLSASEASRDTGISRTCITRCCRGEREHSGGFQWKYS